MAVHLKYKGTQLQNLQVVIMFCQSSRGDRISPWGICTILSYRSSQSLIHALIHLVLKLPLVCLLLLQVTPLTTKSQAPTVLTSMLEATFKTLKSSSGFSAHKAPSSSAANAALGGRTAGSTNNLIFLGSTAGDSTLIAYGLEEDSGSGAVPGGSSKRPRVPLSDRSLQPGGAPEPSAATAALDKEADADEKEPTVHVSFKV